MSPGRRRLEDLVADLAEAVDAAAELVELGKERWDAERPLRLAGEAVVGRIGDIATKLPDELVTGTSDLPWAEIKGMRIVVDHAYHGIDYERVWRTLRDDVPELQRVVGRWVERELGPEMGPGRGQERGPERGPDLGLGL
ncbi:MAG: HepT-like ribonuclease domain-containing protein [Acidimicrobiales bacterium]